MLLKHLDYKPKLYPLNLKPWNNLLKKINNQKYEVTIGVVGKYTNLKDSLNYISEHSPSRKGQIRIIYLYNCSPHNNNLLRFNLRYYCELDKIKLYLIPEKYI